MKAGSRKKNMTLYAKNSEKRLDSHVFNYMLANFRYFSMEYFTVSIASWAFFHSFTLSPPVGFQPLVGLKELLNLRQFVLMYIADVFVAFEPSVVREYRQYFRVWAFFVFNY